MTKIGEILLLTALAFAQAPKVSVQSSIDRSRVGVGDDFVFTVSVITDSSGADISNPRPASLDGFELLETWDATAVTQKLMPGPRGMDFQTQRRREFNYRLRAVRPGRQSIGAFDVSVDGKNHPSQPLVIDVQPTSQGAAPGRGRAQPDEEGFPPGFPGLDEVDRAEEEMFRQLLQRRGGSGLPGGMQRPPPAHRTLPVNPNEAFFVQVEVDKTDVYEGEMVVVSWYIYTRGQMETLDRVKFPDLRGFWKEIIEEVPTIQFTEEIVNGVPYRKALLASHALFPIKPGTAVIDEYKIKARVRLPGQGGFGFNGKPFEYTKSSKRVEIKVKPLPVEGRPASFTGAVGAFEVNAAVDSASVPVGQPFTLRVRFEGQGNAKGIDLPAIDWPKTVEVYDTKSESRFFKNGNSYKQFDVLLIPRQEGDLEIPSFEMSMFNPSTAKYETRKTQPIKLKVVANPNAASGSAQRLSEAGTTAPPTAAAAKAPKAGDVLPEPVVAYSTASMTGSLFRRVDVWVGLYLAVFALLGLKVRTEFGQRDRRRDLNEILKRRYKALDKVVKGGDPRKIGAEMANVFSLVLGDIAGENGASQEVGKMLERIPPSLRRDFSERILQKHEVFQVLAFAPSEALGDLKDPARVRAEVSEAKTLLNQLVKKSLEDGDATV